MTHDTTGPSDPRAFWQHEPTVDKDNAIREMVRDLRREMADALEYQHASEVRAERRVNGALAPGTAAATRARIEHLRRLIG